MQTETLNVRITPAGNGVLVTINDKPFWTREPLGGSFEAVRALEYRTNRHPQDWPDRSDYSWLSTCKTIGGVHAASGLAVLQHVTIHKDA